MKTMFSAYFGSAFLTHSAKESAFAYNVQRYADVYTSKLENFLEYPLDSWLFAPHDVKILPHHIKVSADGGLSSWILVRTCVRVGLLEVRALRL